MRMIESKQRKRKINIYISYAENEWIRPVGYCSESFVVECACHDDHRSGPDAMVAAASVVSAAGSDCQTENTNTLKTHNRQTRHSINKTKSNRHVGSMVGSTTKSIGFAACVMIIPTIARSILLDRENEKKTV